VFRPCAEGHEQSVVPEGGQPIADALLGLRRRRANRLAKIFQRDAMLVGQAGEIFVDGLGFRRHG
jgi:hypothetical protein